MFSARKSAITFSQMISLRSRFEGELKSSFSSGVHCMISYPRERDNFLRILFTTNVL